MLKGAAIISNPSQGNRGVVGCGTVGGILTSQETEQTGQITQPGRSVLASGFIPRSLAFAAGRWAQQAQFLAQAWGEAAVFAKRVFVRVFDIGFVRREAHGHAQSRASRQWAVQIHFHFKQKRMHIGQMVSRFQRVAIGCLARQNGGAQQFTFLMAPASSHEMRWAKVGY